MTELKRMLAGTLYRANDPELAAMRLRARVLTRRFNESDPADPAARRAALCELLGSVGEGVEVEPDLRVDYGAFVTLGARVFVNFNCVLLDCAPITIGEGTLLAPGVHVYAGTHTVDPVRLD